MNRAERRAVERVVQAAIGGTATEIRPGDIAPLHLMPRIGVPGNGPPGDGVVGSGAVRGTRGQFRRAPSRQVAALAAAAAVLVIAAASFGAASALRDDRAEVIGSRAGMGVLALIPRYSIALIREPGLRRQIAEVVESATGKGITALPLPKPYKSVVTVTADADGRTFVLDAQTWRFDARYRPPHVPGHSKLFLVTLGQRPGPQSFTMTPLLLPAQPRFWFPTSLALSPDGTKLAVVYEYNAPRTSYLGASTRLMIYTMASGIAHVFRGNWRIGEGPIDPGSVSWSADDRTLALDAYNLHAPSAVELFNATAVSGTIASNSRPLIKVGPSAYPTTSDVRILPDGTKVVLGVWSLQHPAQLGEVSTATGRAVKTILLNPPAVDGAIPALQNVLWTNRSGSVMILEFLNRSRQDSDRPIYMVLHNGKLTPLPATNRSPLERAW
jgi:hypothetical protein